MNILARALLVVRSQCRTLNDDARFHVVSHLIRETVNCGKSMLASTIMGKDDSDSGSNFRELGSIHNLIQKDRVLAAVSLLNILVIPQIISLVLLLCELSRHHQGSNQVPLLG